MNILPFKASKISHLGSPSEHPEHVVVIGSGAAGLSAAWLLARSSMRVTLVEKDDRLGGHANTASVMQSDGSTQPIDTGFIVYNEATYPNLTEWYRSMGVRSEPSDMSFAVSRNAGRFEYAGGPRLGLFAQPSLWTKPRFYKMLKDLLRFYKEAPAKISTHADISLGDFLKREAYSDEFINDHLMPFAAAIWSTSRANMLDYPASAFIRFCDNHGLLRLRNRPQWRTVSGGSKCYVDAVKQSLGADNIRSNFLVAEINRHKFGVTVRSRTGQTIEADHVVLATHADQALALISDADDVERQLLSPFQYESNLAILHTDIRYLPKRKRAWASWNYVEQSEDDGAKVSVSYWMNKLQNLESDTDYVVSLNPAIRPGTQYILRSQIYEHPIFNADTFQAQQQLWSLQGRRRTWFCGSYFGAGFHEDAVQSGFAAAEQLSGIMRPWTVESPSGRIFVNNTKNQRVVAA
ncbi:MAG: FAD-dependent oxidoreductase [Gammaproteobacteria bacterium]|nr:FAD-dependent oxidoreductase [Gammaproteobacteria bacterium]